MAYNKLILNTDEGKALKKEGRLNFKCVKVIKVICIYLSYRLVL